MIRNIRKRWQTNRVRPGDGSHLREFRAWQLFSRSLFYIRLHEETGSPSLYAIDVHLLTDQKSRSDHEAGKGKAPAALYRDGVQVARSNVPTMFPVPGGFIEVATTGFGLKRMHYVTDDGAERLLRPDPRSQEGRRAQFAERFPTVSNAIGIVSLIVLLVALALGLGHGVETFTEIPPIAEGIGTFESPVDLPVWVNTSIIIAALLAGYERATRLRHHWLIDSAAS